ncbi:hypothetical protein [Brevundimonas sp.]|uniref:hypothetical protein n=1 Tax=Brevundimonas sp. TaxID=1871086 RepID=UPI00261DB726|nr:hypothetical protein [Brevundimonas sp.]
MVQQPRFQPWKPNDLDARFHGVKLLILGESHYEEPKEGVFDHNTVDPQFTCSIVRKWGIQPERRQRFFANLFEMMIGLAWTREGPHDRLWQSIFFGNYVQALVSGGDGKCPSSWQFVASERAFRAVLEDIRPNAVLAMGARLWNNMPPADAPREEVSKALGLTCAYRLADGTEVLAAHTWHPSAPRMKPDQWHPRILEFIQDVQRWQRAQDKILGETA